MQQLLFQTPDSTQPRPVREVTPFRTQLLKWIGNKQRFAHEIVGFFPERFETYFEPFVGSAAVLATLAPKRAVASDLLKPLIEIWQTLSANPSRLKEWYTERWNLCMAGDKIAGYERIKASYNSQPNPADLLFLSRACYGGVVRFRQSDGHISTPCGIHRPISPAAFAKRVDIWHDRTKGAEFVHSDFEPVMDSAQPEDVVYCDPPYLHTQSILYGAQSFDLQRLFAAIGRCKARGVYVLLSIDGTKKSGRKQCRLPIPEGLFEREAFVDCGRSMLRRFQREGENLGDEVVADRLLLTW
ncbi:MAG TPA: Dam family site-specific DNA-(adenine-N6)-methyltransferase [Phycisphaerae bacterium]|nr:Dam family site-specific DNA-(adenine-N6)-methyltransferase [Phycisphaerae bacterium]